MSACLWYKNTLHKQFLFGKFVPNGSVWSKWSLISFVEKLIDNRGRKNPVKCCDKLFIVGSTSALVGTGLSPRL